MKYLILVGDGMGDYPLAEQQHKTPLELAKTPYIDALCARGELFFNQTVPPGFPPGSDVANMSLMGYNPGLYYTGRAPLEAAAMGIELGDDQYAFRCNMVTLEHRINTIIMDDFSAGHISSEEARLLIADIEKECGSELFSFRPGVSYRNLMLFSGEPLGFTTEPPHDHIGKDVTELFQRYLQIPVWKELLEKIGKILKQHPVNKRRQQQGKKPCNMFWLWGEGKKPQMPLITEQYGISGTMISAVDLLKGIGVMAGLATPDIVGATGY
ncbi:phosphoglycerate mutase, partial [candidate division KSB3 bacterium]